ncbi:MAG: hypothetical protein IJY81_02985, partial [Lachnospiraceae bacterium]|nr:hypothetical protein [Lachnospiraceae bacterium]
MGNCMEANYIRNYLNSYLVLPGDKNLKNYESKIIEENKIAGFLQVQTNCINQEFKYMYDISSKQSLKEVLEKKKFKKDDIIKLVNGILEVTQQIREYLLEINNIVLDPEYIYMDFSEFASLVNHFSSREGGVLFNMPVSIYSDKQGAVVNIPKGLQRFDGALAKQLASFVT